MSLKKRYRPLWVILHWLMAALVFLTFSIGLFDLTATSPSSTKLVPLAVHISLGLSILLIVIARYLLRLLVFKPARRAASAPALRLKQTPLLDRLSLYVHPLLYLFTALMALLGLAIALPADLIPAVLSGNPARLPPDFYVYPARVWHGSLSLLLMLLIAQHVLVAVYHQFIKGENFLARMWFTG